MNTLINYFKIRKHTPMALPETTVADNNADLAANLVKNEIKKLQKAKQSLENVINEFLIENDRIRGGKS